MPRGVRKAPAPVSERLAACEAKIEKLTAELKNAKKERQAILDEQADTEKEELVKAFQASGKSLNEVLEFFSQGIAE